MKNRIIKAAEEYKKTYYGNHSTEGQFYSSDICEVKEAAENAGGGYSNHIYTAIETALAAGFTIGYRKGRKDSRKPKRRKQY